MPKQTTTKRNTKKPASKNTRRKTTLSSNTILGINKRMLLFIALFAVVGGAYLLYSTFALTAVSKVPIPSTGAYWGINLETADHVLQHEAATAGNRKFQIVRQFYTSWAQRTAVPNAEGRQMADGGRYVHMSIKTAPWAQMANGSKDAEIDELAVRMRDWNKPVMLSLWHEPDDRDACDFPNQVNTAGCQGTSTDFRNMWRRVHSRFQAAGATNVSFVWTTTAYSFQPASGRAAWVQNMYPGSDVTDWIAADAYNFINDAEPFNYAKFWKPLSQAMDPWYDWAAAQNKPLILAEWGSLEDTSTPGRKAAWFKEAQNDLKTKYPRVKAVEYFDRNHTHEGRTRDWRVVTSASARDTFYAMGHDTYFNPVIGRSGDPIKNTLPVVRMVSPVSGTTRADSIDVNAGVTDTDGTITKVDLLIDGVVKQSKAYQIKSTILSFTWNSREVANGSHKVSLRAYDNAGGQATMDAVITIDNQPYGLTGQYFGWKTLSNLKATRADQQINFDWGKGAPVAGMDPDRFGVRWTGKVIPTKSERYTFYTITDDGVRLWVNGQLIIDKWKDQIATQHTGSIDLKANQLYDIKMEFYDNTSSATARLSWSSAGTPKAIIPASQLRVK